MSLWNELWRVARFAAVGATATLTHIGVAGVLLLAIDDAPVLVVNLVAYLCAFAVSLTGHQRITFRQRAKLPHFIAMSLAGYGLNNLLLLVGLWLDLPSLIAVIVATMLTAACSYLLARHWVFRHSHS